VNDVTVGETWHVSSITQYYSSWNFDWLNLQQGYVTIMPKTGDLPTLDPTGGEMVAMSAYSYNADCIAVTLTDMEVVLEPGEYWIGITPQGPVGMFGANMQFATDTVGVDIASFDTMFGAWGNTYPGYDGAMLIEGEAVVATESVSLSEVKALFQ